MKPIWNRSWFGQALWLSRNFQICLTVAVNVSKWNTLDRWRQSWKYFAIPVRPLVFSLVGQLFQVGQVFKLNTALQVVVKIFDVARQHGALKKFQVFIFKIKVKSLRFGSRQWRIRRRCQNPPAIGCEAFGNLVRGTPWTSPTARSSFLCLPWTPF